MLFTSQHCKIPFCATEYTLYNRTGIGELYQFIGAQLI